MQDSRISPLLFSALLCLFASPALMAANETDPSAMRQSLWQAFHDARHAIETETSSHAPTQYTAYNPANHMNFRFDQSGLHLYRNTASGEWNLNMRFAGYGHEDSMSELPEVLPEVDGRRVDYRRGPVTEWFINDNAGLEHGFTLHAPPHGYGEGQTVRVAMSLETELVARLSPDQQALNFTMAGGPSAFSYAKLLSFDANGMALPSRMALDGHTLSIEVETADAQWPITIDPVFYSEYKITGVDSEAALNDWFGYSVALEGDTAVVGAVNSDAVGVSRGAAYVFERVGAAWNFQARLSASDGNLNDRFGYSVGLAGDTIVVGANWDDDAGDASGSAYVFVKPGVEWFTTTETAKLTASDAATGDEFGTTVSIAGDTVVIGAPRKTGAFSNSGAAYVFVKPGGGWITGTETAKLVPSVANASQFFGRSSAIEGDTVVIGATGGNGIVANSGTAYIFVKPGGGWVSGNETAVLTASDGANFDTFGVSVGISGDTVAVGASGKNGVGSFSGAVYVFVEPGGGWTSTTQNAVLTASDSSGSEVLGVSVGIEGDTIVSGAFNATVGAVGTAGAAYVFVEPGGGWVNATQTAKLIAGDAELDDEFGFSVAISASTIITGVRLDDEEFGATGSVRVFDRPAGGWVDSIDNLMLTAVQSQSSRRFGADVAIDGDTAIIGARGDVHAGSSSGSAFVFQRVGARWAKAAKLTASDATLGASFGKHVDLDGTVAVVGADLDPGGGTRRGAVYVYTRAAGGWADATETAKLTASDTIDSHFLGSAVAISGDVIAAGAAGDADGGLDSGAVYVYEMPVSGWTSTTETAKLTASDADVNDILGASIAMEGTTIVSGARGESAFRGSAYVFVRPGSNWADMTETAKLEPSDHLVTFPNFGGEVTISDDVILVGALSDPTDAPAGGSAYIFEKPPAGWKDMTETAKLRVSDPTANKQFGFDVALSGKAAVVSSPNDLISGAASVFIRPHGGWASSFEHYKLTQPDPLFGDDYSSSVAIGGDTLIVGAEFDNSGAGNAGSAYINRFECGFGGHVTALRWTMIAIPCDLGSANTIGDVLGDNFANIDYLWTWAVYKRDEASDSYILQGLGSPLELGKSYWILSQTGGFWDAGAGSLTPVVTGGDCPGAKGCIEIPLVGPADGASDRFNMIGHPLNISTDWAGVRFIVDGVPYSPSEAELAGYIENTLWKYNGNGYDSFDDATPGMEGSLDIYDGLWVKVLSGAFGSTVSMLIPYGNSFPTPPGPPTAMNELEKTWRAEQSRPLWTRVLNWLIPSAVADKPQWDQEWYLRLIAVSPAERLADRNNVLGQLSESDLGFDDHDLLELAPFAAPYLTVSFPHHDWADKAGSYNSDYHPTLSGEPDQWVFEVRSDDPFRQVELYWDGIYLLEGTWSQSNGKKTWSQSKQKDADKLLGQMWLEDLDTGERIPAADGGVLNSYSFSMDGENVRTFRWVLTGKNGKSPRFREFSPSPSLSVASKPGRALDRTAPPGDPKK